MLTRMTVPGESIPEEESEDTDGTDIDSMGDINESSPAILSPAIMSPDPSPAHTRPHGKARKTKFRGAPYKGYKGEGVVYLPGDIKGLAKKLQLLAAERNELVHVLDALLRLKQLTRKVYTNITTRLAARLYTRVDVLQ